ncbi:MAG: hypothetical protein ACREJD_01980 [Phycisphaerales bacterium]
MQTSTFQPAQDSGSLPDHTQARERLVVLGRSGKAWDFLLPASQHLEAHPDDHGLRLLAISSFARLGFRSPALEHFSQLPAALRDSKELEALLAATRTLPDDRVDGAILAKTLRSNLDALGTRLDGDIANVLIPAGLECFRANDGNIARRINGKWIALHGEIAAAKKALQDHTRAWATDPTQTLVLEGVHPPWLLKSAMDTRPREALGYRAPVHIVQQDADEFAIGLSLVDLSSHLGDGHVHAFIGPGASARFATFLNEGVDRRLLGTVATTPGTRTLASPTVTERVAEAIRHQDQQTRQLEREVQEMYAGRDRVWWAKRFSESSPKRVLLLTSRFSTFVKHSTRDLADALAALGHEARVIMQPDDSSSLAACGYLRAVRDFDPHLIVVINYPRATIGDFLPRNIPWVCWIQDQMPHLFDERIGRGLGPLDFTIGHVTPAMHDRYGYPRESSMVLPVPASETKFFASESSETERAKFECEIAYVSHQSETPEAQHDRILSELRSNPTVDAALIRALPVLRDAVRAHVHLPLSTLPFPSMKDVVRETLTASLGGEAPAHVVDLLTTGYADPLADRIMRHETLEWAAAAARNRGWRFNLYGKGWQHHPKLTEFAKGPLGHDSDLRKSYQLAGCHLQVTYHMLAHPRLCECVLSGGVPLCRLHWGERSMIETPLFMLGWHQGAEFRDDRVTEDVRRAPWTDAPALIRFASVFQSLGCFDQAIAPDDVGNCQGHAPGSLKGLRWGAPFHPRLVKDRRIPVEFANPSAFSMVGEQPEFFFHSAATLESRVAAIIESPDLREVRNTVARKRIAARHTYRSAAQRILTFVNERLVSADKAIPPAA